MSKDVQNAVDQMAAQGRSSQPSNCSTAGDMLAVVFLCGLVAVACGSNRAKNASRDAGVERPASMDSRVGEDLGTAEPMPSDAGDAMPDLDTAAPPKDVGRGEAAHDTVESASADSETDVPGSGSEDTFTAPVEPSDAVAERGRDRGGAPSDVVLDAPDAGDSGASNDSPDVTSEVGENGSTYVCGVSTCSTSQYCVRAVGTSQVPPPACLPVPSDGVCPPGTELGCQEGQAGCGELLGSTAMGACRASSCSDATLCQCLCSSIGNGRCSREGQVITCFVS